MSEVFRKHLEKFIEVSDEEFVEIFRFFKVISVSKKENLQMEGQVCKLHFFVIKGCLRKFFINDKGGEQTTHFALEHWWITDNFAYEQQRVSEFYIQAVEKSEVLTIDQVSQEALLTLHPKMERYFRFIYQRACAAAEMRIKYLYDMSKEEYYHHFNNSYPEFVQRIPQYLLASFLGLTPEYVSEIRSKRSQ